MIITVLSYRDVSYSSLSGKSKMYNWKHTQGNSLPTRAKAENAQEKEGIARASRERGKLRGRNRGRGEGWGRKVWGEGGSIGDRERRGEGICRARAVPSQDCARDRRWQRKTRNSEEAHDKSFSDCKAKASWNLPIADGTKLRTSGRIQQRGKTLASEETQIVE
jgi:hypothetical protein